MFDHLQRELRRLSQKTEISVPLQLDADGYIDKECPAPSCLFPFKVHAADWGTIVRDEEVFCPSCRHAAPATSWYTTEQLEQAKQYALNHIKNEINAAMRADAAASKRRQRPNSFIKMTLEVKGGHDAALLPIAAAEPMRLRTMCEACQCRYSYIGAAYFCPSCGANSARHTFQQTLVTIRAAAQIGATLRKTLDPDAAEIMTRTLLEKALQDTVTSFQRLCEQLYEAKTGVAAKRNAFQRLDTGSALWEKLLSQSYEDMIGSTQLVTLHCYYQQRHLLAHQQGIVDADYITRSGDETYRTGQRLIIREADALEFASLIEQLGLTLLEKV